LSSDDGLMTAWEAVKTKKIGNRWRKAE
jgi:hypothetical protein